MAKAKKKNSAEFGRNYTTKALEAADHLEGLLNAIRGLKRLDAISLVRLLKNAHVSAYEGSDLPEPLGRGWCLSDLDVVDPVMIKVCAEYDVDVPEIEGLATN